MEEDAPAVPADPPPVDSAAVVSETDAAHSSADDEGWLRHTHIRRNQRRAINDETSHDDDSENGEDAMKEAAGPGDLYDGNMDDEDEAWVYKHMRSGREELVHLRRQPQKDDSESKDEQMDTETSGHNVETKEEGDPSYKKSEKGDNDEPENNQQMQQALLLKPRNSDAVLSCPRCFTTVCMDCQQHERYANQYRAMFVMNIGVDWEKKATWDEAIGGLKLIDGETEAGGDEDARMQLNDDSGGAAAFVPVEHGTQKNSEKGEMYYSVHCNYCQYEVAALDMKDEIYHFFGCLASA